ncbi:CdaR family transcriptional regulator [Nonomuraea polychroma]|uniref:CdaR family transcriptional regulator n=1 Tax=Nonomuraea polychroma TaxID=46176 RepID=A0A438M1Y2_9ACTN|nr:PucR family transcriptional regulator ligand-binding domain-containing protein [Nonomuraea polychroma]RVX39840.1 CdaR family transcriptional regulator [Nonomuraea polychroma]
MTGAPHQVPSPAAAPVRGRVLTVADVLALPVLAAGRPQVVAGESQLGRSVRWVHITELTDPASFLKGGELVLTTGMPLPREPALVRRYVDELATVGAAGLVLELVRRYHRPPEELVRACSAHDLPLVLLSRDVNFLEVTQVVHELLLGNQVETLRRTQEIHETFTGLTLRGAGAAEVMRAAAEMSGRAVVLENQAHQALICEPSARTVEEVLTDWERRSRATPPTDSAAVSGPEGWLVCPVEYRGERCGRVVMLPDRTAVEPAFAEVDTSVLERAAMSLAISRLIHPAAWERGAHRGALLDLAEQRYRTAGEAAVRTAALGLPARDCRYVAVLVDLPGDEFRVSVAELEESLVKEVTAAGVPALVGELGAGRIGVLVGLRHTKQWRPAVELIGRAALELAPQAVVSVGSEVADLSQAARSFRDASHVAESALPGTSSRRPYHELSDIGLRQLLYALRSDVRLQGYVERQVGRLIDYDHRHNTDLVSTLRHYLDAAGNKTVAAQAADLSRQTLYQRLHIIERLLGSDLESGQRRTELHVALTALDVLRLGSR